MKTIGQLLEMPRVSSVKGYVNAYYRGLDRGQRQREHLLILSVILNAIILALWLAPIIIDLIYT